jgi:hypothetical protein
LRQDATGLAGGGSFHHGREPELTHIVFGRETFIDSCAAVIALRTARRSRRETSHGSGKRFRRKIRIY